MVQIERTVRMQQLHYLLSETCMCGTGRKFDSMVTEISTYMSS